LDDFEKLQGSDSYERLAQWLVDQYMTLLQIGLEIHYLE
jgi:hypothetical protein